MFEAFESTGYDVKLVMGEGGHDLEQAGAILPEAMRWLWRGYPEPIVVHEPPAMTQPSWDPRGKVYSVVSADKPWRQVGDTYGSVASLTGDKDGNVFFADAAASRIYKVDADDRVTLFKDHANGARALRVGPDRRLYAFQPTLKRIVVYSSDGHEEVVAENVEASDMAITAQSTLYFADAVHSTVGYIDAKRRTRIVYDGGEIALPSGVALSPDQAMLIVTDGQGRFSWSFQIVADGSLIHGEPYYRLEMPETGWMSGVHGVMEDSNGQVYFATPPGIQFCEANGRVAGILNPPERGVVTELTFAGKNLDWLYVAEGGKLFRRPVKVTGAAVSNPTKPPKAPL